MITLGAVFEQLTTNGLVERMSADELNAKLSDPEASSLPGFLSGLVILAAWFGALLVFAFLTLVFLGSPGGLIVLGVLFVGGAAFLRRGAGSADPGDWMGPFGVQLALASSLVGQGAILAGLAMQTDSEVATALGAVALGLVLLLLYQDRLHRFLSALLALAGLMGFLWELGLREAVHPYVTALAAGTVWMWSRERTWLASREGPVLRAVAYALPVGLLGLLLLSTVQEAGLSYWWVSAVGLLAVLLWLEWLVLGDYGRRDTALARLVLVATASLVFPAVLGPGLLGAMIVMMIGFWRGERLLASVAGLFLAAFLVSLYYHLEITLLTKSLALMGSGLTIVALRGAMLGWWREEAPYA